MKGEKEINSTLKMHLSHSTKGEEFLSHAKILVYFYSSPNILLLEVCFD